MVQKGDNEMYCRSCGKIIERDAAFCPECGSENKAGVSSQSTSRQEPPKSDRQQNFRQQSGENQTSSRTNSYNEQTEHTTTVSDSWHYGILAGIALWIGLFATVNMMPAGLEALMGFITLVAWVIVPVSVYYDIKYVRANSQWDPSTVGWIIGSSIWVINIIVGAVYLYRRNETVGF